MRVPILGMLVPCVVLFSLAPVGCGTSTAESPDASTGSPDASTGSPDASFGTQTCLQVITCAAGCAGMSACESACEGMGSAKAQTQYQALFACAYGVCTAPADGGAPACTSSSDTSAGCQSCVESAAQGSSCVTPLGACLGS
jgi:hypothetical protein